jgi:ATP-binding cassette subfamily B protein
VLALSGFALAAWLLIDHLQRAGEVGMVLLLVYWILTLPELGQQIAGVIHQYPTFRNIMLRLLEPLGAPDETDTVPGGTAPEPPTTAATAAAAGTADTAAEAAGGTGVSMCGVTVLAGGHVILQDINLEIEPGSHLAIVGPSGAGKSSLVGLLLGWHRAASGTLRVDGELLAGEVLRRLRQHTAWIDPAVQLWNRTFIENLRFGTGGNSPIPLSTVLAGADLYQVLERLPDGLQTMLGEGGGLVSGGEGQRVRLGRAMLRPGVRMTILDEPFRGLDRSLRHQMLARARELWQQATLICITHDVGETCDFERVVVMNEGKIVEDDSPSHLRNQPQSLYSRMLAAEQQVREQLWENPEWRLLTLANGRIEESREPEVQR